MKRVFLIEDHHQAYFIWKKFGLKDVILFHFDAHHDCEIDYLHEKNIQINNYISKALENNFIKTFYWIIPGYSKEFQSNYLRLMQLLFQLKQTDFTSHNKIIVEKNCIKTKILGKSSIITTIDQLQLSRKDKKILLDIDLDYFFIKSLYSDKAIDEVGLRKQWISLSNFTNYIYKLFPKIDCITISYSVNGGWIPAKFKHIGNLLAKKLGFNDFTNEKYIIAGKLFYMFRENFEKSDFKKAKKYYRSALNINPTYFTPDNNYGRLYLMKGDFTKAEIEFNNMLKIDRNYYYSYIGLGIIYLIKRNYKEALKNINKGLNIDRNNLILLFLKALTYKYLKDYKQSKKIVGKIIYLHKKEEFKMIFHKIFGFDDQKNILQKYDIIDLMNNLKKFSLLEKIITYEIKS